LGSADHLKIEDVPKPSPGPGQVLIKIGGAGVSIFTVPVVLGGGKRLFADGSAPHSYKLASSRVSRMGLMISHYERAGEIAIGDTALESPSDR
jgi:hypothetical protein